MSERGRRGKAFKAAFPHTIPIFAGFWFLGMTYGIYMNVSGFPFWYPMLMSLTIFAGSVEFVAVNLLLGAFNPFQVLAMTLMINARHLFYGLSMLDKYRGNGWKDFYLIFGMCDESFSINYTARIPEGIDRGWFMFFVTLLNHFYWFFGAALGGIFGSLIRFHTEWLWNLLGMVLVGWGSVLLGGCPLRQLILAGEGNTDSAVTVTGFIVGAAISHNFGLASSGAGIGTGPVAAAVAAGFVVLAVISVTNMQKLEG